MGEPVPLFLFSLPRSGSTLLQRMLAAHSAISTTPEPWVLLPLLYAISPRGSFTEYGHATSVRALEGLFERLPDGRDSYLKEVRRLAERLYSQASEPASSYFLDKTPRYNLIASDVLDLFPEAKFIVLWRNPLAVVGSIIDSWTRGQWKPYHHKIDLFEGLERLLEASTRHQDKIVSLRYVDLLTDPERELARLLEYLGLQWEPGVLDAQRVQLGGTVGDKTGIRAYDRVSQEPLEKWRLTLASPVRKRWCRRYLNWIGVERLRLMGYELDELLAELEAIPSRWSQAGPDILQTAKGAAWSLSEPQILRHKLRVFPQWHRIHAHT